MSYQADNTEATTPGSRFVRALENLAQSSVANSNTWLLARYLFKLDESKRPQRIRLDSRPLLEKLGFTVERVVDDLLYQVLQPEGWTKETQGFWTYVSDVTGQNKIQQFYKPTDKIAMLEEIK